MNKLNEYLQMGLAVALENIPFGGKTIRSAAPDGT